MNPGMIQALVQHTNAEISEFTVEEAEQYINSVSSLKNTIDLIWAAFQLVGMGKDNKGIQDLIDSYASGNARASMEKFKTFSAKFFAETSVSIYKEDPKLMEALTSFETQARFYKEYKTHEASLAEKLSLAEQIIATQTPSLGMK